jgi:hypothetical protein
MRRRLKMQQRKKRVVATTRDESLAAPMAVPEAQSHPFVSTPASNGLLRKPARRSWKVIGICAALAISSTTTTTGMSIENTEVVKGLTPGGVARAFTHKEGGLWTPLVTISHMLDCQLYGLKPEGIISPMSCCTLPRPFCCF